PRASGRAHRRGAAARPADPGGVRAGAQADPPARGADRNARRGADAEAVVSQVFLSIGSNLGDRLQLMREAVRRLIAGGDIRVVETSRLYETEPWETEPRSEEHTSELQSPDQLV